jgi:hypothetical protein
MNEPPLVRIAANCVHRMIYQYRDDFLAGMIIAGWDKKLGGQVSQKYSIKHFFSQSFILGLLLSTWWFTCSTTGFTWWFG